MIQFDCFLSTGLRAQKKFVSFYDFMCLGSKFKSICCALYGSGGDLRFVLCSCADVLFLLSKTCSGMEGTRGCVCDYGLQ